MTEPNQFELSSMQRKLLDHMENKAGHGALLPRRSGVTTAIAEYCAKHPDVVDSVVTVNRRSAEDLKRKIEKFGQCHTRFLTYGALPRGFGSGFAILEGLYDFSDSNMLDIAQCSFVFFNPTFTPEQFSRLELGGSGRLITRVWGVPPHAVPLDARESGDGSYHWSFPCAMGVDLALLIEEARAYVAARSDAEAKFEFSCTTTSEHYLNWSELLHLLQIRYMR